jgi:hypothetical protein
MRKHIREALDELRGFGATIVGVEQNSHVKIRYRDGQGHEDILVMSTSPSSRNAIHNQQAFLRRKFGKVRP